MPVRIYDIARKLGIESKEVLVRAKELGVAGARVPSSTLDKITAEYLEQEIAKTLPPPPPVPPPAEITAPPPAEPPPSEPEAVVEIPADGQVSTPHSETAGPEVAESHSPAAPPSAVAEVKTIEPAPESLSPPTAIEPAPVQELKAFEPSHPELAATGNLATPAEPPAPIAAETVPQPPTQPPILVQEETTTTASELSTPTPTVESKSPGMITEAAHTEMAATTLPVEPPKATPPVETESKPVPMTATPDISALPMPVAEAIMPPSPPLPPAPPPPPPVPKVGDKVGFIQLPPKPAPKVGDKVGSIKLPPRPIKEADRGRGDIKPGSRPPFAQPAQMQAKVKQPHQHQRMPMGAPSRMGGGGKHEAGKSAAAAPVLVGIITMKPPIVVRLLADLLKRKPFELIRDLMELGVFANVNQAIEEPTAQRLCAKYGFRFELERRKSGGGLVHGPIKPKDLDPDDKPEELKPRAPVVTIMGHVDHGKTTLLDVIRKANVAASEAGGITQHIGAYTISIPHPERPKDLQQITFLDTPGHAAFSAMRARGAHVTDIVVLVVAANDGVMPQTEEAISHARAAKVPIIVAVNKCDHPAANSMAVRQRLQALGLAPEEWGGSTIFQDVSALQKKGIDKLLEMILLQAEMMELKANPNRPAKGNVIESGLAPGGPTATVLVRKGTLKVGDVVLCGPFWGKARALINEEGKRLQSVGPSVAVKLLGLNGVPVAGVEFSVPEDEKSARDMAEKRAEELRTISVEDRPKTSLEDLLDKLNPDGAKVLKVVVKADTQGSVEAITEELKKIDSDKVSLEIAHYAVGIISESDVNLAAASKAVILGFHTRIDAEAVDAAKRHGVQIKLYSIIYELIDEVRLVMAGLLDPIIKEVSLGSAEVKQVFNLSKGGNAAGCMVVNGRVIKGRCRILRRKDRIYEGVITTLRRFQDEVPEVRSGLECGIRVDGFGDFQVGDLVECYQAEKIAQKL